MDRGKVLPGQPVGCNYGRRSMNYGLLYGIVAYFGFPGSFEALDFVAVLTSQLQLGQLY